MTGRRARHAMPEPGTGELPAIGEPAGVVPPSLDDPVARAASAVAGGPAGRRLATATGFWRAVPVLVLLAVAVLAGGVIERQHCRAEGWTTPDQFWHACYSDIPVLFGSSGLGAADRPSLSGVTGESGLGQPPLAAAAMWVVSGVVGGEDAQAPRRFFDTSVVLLAVLLCVAVVALAAAAGRRRWDAAHLAVSPVLLTAGLVSYGLLAVSLLSLALLACSRHRAVAGGVLLGLAVAAGGFPVLLVGVALVVAGVVSGRAGPAARAVAAGLVTWLLVRALLLAEAGAGLRAAFAGWREAPPGYGSFWLIPQLLDASRPNRAHWWYPFRDVSPLSAPVASGLSLVATLVVVAGVAAWVLRPASWFRTPPAAFAPPPAEAGEGWEGWRAPAGWEARRVARIALALVAFGLVAGTSLPVQASLLLLPLVALAGLRWRDHLIWAATECAYFVGVWLYIAAQSDPDRGLPADLYLALLLARLAGITWLGVQALRPPPAAPVAPRPSRVREETSVPV